MSSSNPPAGQVFFDRIPANADSTSAAQCRVLYDQWASTYDRDLTDPSQGYVAPANAAKAILSHNHQGRDGRSTILDAGCGTGLSGIAVRDALGSEVIIDGIDVSSGMLEIASKANVYRRLEIADLSQPLSIPNEVYDVVVCVGTLTGGHVGPVPALQEFARVCRSGGLVVVTIRDSIWVRGGYEAEVERLVGDGVVELRSADSAMYRQGQGVSAKMLIMAKA